VSAPLIPELPGFDDPLGVLRACHERMLSNCDTLQKLPPHIAAHGVDDEARRAINRIVTYFSTSAVHHHQDEEQDLFPLLIRQSLKLAEIVHWLKQDHEILDQRWQALLPDLQEPATLAENTDFAAHADAFCEAYRAHIRIENQDLLGTARHILSHQQLQEIGRAMAKRRGIHRQA
jgi:hemerythrin-like domain-containing protein